MDLAVISPKPRTRLRARFLTIGGFMVSISLLMPSIAGAADSFSDQVQHDLVLKDVKRLALIVPKGEVRILGWSQDRIRIILKKRTQANSEDEAKTRFAEADLSRLDTPESVELRVAHKRGGNLIDRLKSRSSKDAIEVDWEIRAPWSLDLDISTVEGNINLDQWHGGLSVRIAKGNVRFTNLDLARKLTLVAPETAVEIIDAKINGTIVAGSQQVLLQKVQARPELFVETNKGDIRIENAKGEFRAHTNAGKISAQKLDGSLNIKTNQGAVEVQNFSGFAEVRTISGSVNMNWKKFSGASWVETEGGVVNLTLPPKFEGKLDLLSLAGQTVVQFPVERDIEDRGKYGPDAPGKLQGYVVSMQNQLRVYAKTAPIRILRSEITNEVGR